MALKLSSNIILIRNCGTPSVMLDEGIVALGLRSGSYFNFNRIGSEIWGMLDEPCEVGQLIDTLLQLHDVERDVLKQDVTAFLQELIENNLVLVIDLGKRA